MARRAHSASTEPWISDAIWFESGHLYLLSGLRTVNRFGFRWWNVADRRHQALLAELGALKGLSGHRHRARWAVAGVEAPLPLFDGVPQTAEPNMAIPLPTPSEDVVADYASIGLTLGRHPLSLIRKQLAARRCLSSADLAKLPHGKRVRFVGLVRIRQRPENAPRPPAA